MCTYSQLKKNTKIFCGGKLVFQFASFNRQMTPNDKEEKLILLLVRNF